MGNARIFPIQNLHREETIAPEKVKAKYLDEFGRQDLYFFLGTPSSFMVSRRIRG